MAGGLDKKLFGDIVKRPDNPKLDAAERRAIEIVDRAKLNEAIRVVDELIDEVSTMHIAERYRRDKKPTESVVADYGGGTWNASLSNLTEDEFKRQLLLNTLNRVKTDIVRSVNSLHTIVLDIEATKTDG